MSLSALTLEETAVRLVRYQHVESRLFEVLGVWSTQVPEAEVKLALSAHAQEHAWHASLWRDRLPALAELGSDPLDNFMSALVAPQAADQTLEKVVGVYRVLLPHIIVTYSRHLGQTSAVSDGPVMRALKLVLNDEMEEWRLGEGLVQDLLTSPGYVSRASAHQSQLESLLLESLGRDGHFQTASTSVTPGNSYISEPANLAP